jgi:hypothetical protein
LLRGKLAPPKISTQIRPPHWGVYSREETPSSTDHGPVVLVEPFVRVQYYLGTSAKGQALEVRGRARGERPTGMQYQYKKRMSPAMQTSAAVCLGRHPYFNSIHYVYIACTYVYPYCRTLFSLIIICYDVRVSSDRIFPHTWRLMGSGDVGWMSKPNLFPISFCVLERC